MPIGECKEKLSTNKVDEIMQLSELQNNAHVQTHELNNLLLKQRDV
jgi:hypothetical protein